MHHVFCLQTSDGCGETQNGARPHDRIVGSAIETNRTKAMNLDQIPTPESDDCYNKCVLTPGPGNGLVMRSKMRDLERRLTIAREAMQAALTASFRGQTGRAHSILDEAITQTAPKQCT